jgi:type II secretory pathway pseudopilin PulG
MKAPQGGYTLLEVTLFLAISSLIFATTILAFKGQYSSNEFLTSMNDVNSKIQQYINDVNNGFNGADSSNNSYNFVCDLNPPGLQPTSRPVLKQVGSSGVGANDQCIFLGKIIHFSTTAPNNDKVYVYPVLGRRLYNSSGQVIPVDKLSAANPTPAVGWPSPNQVDTTSVYNIPRGARVVYARDTSVTPNQTRYFAGFFTSLTNVTGAASTNGNTNIIAVQYPYPGTSNNAPVNAPNSGIISCIEFQPPLCNNAAQLAKTNPFALKTWEICFASTPDGNRALLTFTSNNGFGVQTDLRIGKLDVC